MMIGYAIGGADDWSTDSFKVKGRVLDLSVGGAALFTKQTFESGQNLQLTIKLRDRSEIRTNAGVRWVKPWPDKGGFIAGVQFVSPSSHDQQRIHKFLKELDAELAQGW